MQCRKCLSELPQKQFYFNKTKASYERWCVECHRQYRREHYRLNMAAYVAKSKKNKALTITKISAVLNDLKAVPCMDCGGNFPVICMDFDHRDPKHKVLAVSGMRGRGWSLERIREEIAKCDVVCSNCHRIRTHPHLYPRATNA
jgi:hypothetical protein